MNEPIVGRGSVALVPPAARVEKSPEPDAHGQAAMLLAESILHALVEASIFSVEDAISVITTTCEVKVEVAELAGESHGRMQESLDLLRKIAVSFEADASQRHLRSAN